MPTITEDKFKKLKQEVEDAKNAAERSQGALEQLLKRLKEEFDCPTAKEAKAKLAQLQKAEDLAQRAYDDALADYEKKWKRDEH
jgi:hypothetical protein